MSGAGKSVLITGSRGFTGAYICDALRSAGYRCIGLTMTDAAEDEVNADLSDPASLIAAIDKVRPNFVIHLAAISFVAHNDPLGMYRVNLFGTLNLLEAIERAGVAPKKIILASSANVYGAHPSCPVSEDFPPAPVNHYAMSKLSMECLSRNWLDRFPIVITRPFNYTGPGQHVQFLIPKIVDHYVNRKPGILLGNLDVEREFNDVRMVAYAYRGLLEDAPSGAVVNICTGIGHRLTDILRLMEELTGHKLEVKVDPALVRPNELRKLVGDPSRLQQLVPSLPQFSIRDTLASMIDSALPGNG